MKKNVLWWLLSFWPFWVVGCTNNPSISIKPVLQTTQGLSMGEITHVVFTLNGDSGTTVSKTFTHGDDTWQVTDFSIGEKVQAHVLVFVRHDAGWTTWEGKQSITLVQGENNLAISAEPQESLEFTLSAEFTNEIPFVGDLTFEATDVLTGFTQDLGVLDGSVTLPAGRAFRLDADHPDPTRHVLIKIGKDTESQTLIADMGDAPDFITVNQEIDLEAYTVHLKDLNADPHFPIECIVGETCDDPPTEGWIPCDASTYNWSSNTNTKLLMRYQDVPSLCTEVLINMEAPLLSDADVRVAWDPATLQSGTTTVSLDIFSEEELIDILVVVTGDTGNTPICTPTPRNNGKYTCTITFITANLVDGAEIEVKGTFKNSNIPFLVPMRVPKITTPPALATPRLIGITTMPQVVPNHLEKIPVGFNIWIPQQPSTLYSDVPCNIKINSLTLTNVTLTNGTTEHVLYAGRTAPDIYQLPMLPLASSVLTVWKQASIPPLEKGVYAVTAKISYARCTASATSEPVTLTITDRLHIIERQDPSNMTEAIPINSVVPVLLTDEKLIFLHSNSVDLPTGLNTDAANTQLLWDPDTDTVFIVDADSNRIFQSLQATPRTLSKIAHCTIPTAGGASIDDIVAATIIPAEGITPSQLLLAHKQDDNDVGFCNMSLSVTRTVPSIPPTTPSEPQGCWADVSRGVLAYNPWGKRAILANDHCLFASQLKDDPAAQSYRHSFGAVENVSLDPHSMEVIIQRNTGNMPAFASFRPLAGQTSLTFATSTAGFAALDTWTGKVVQLTGYTPSSNTHLHMQIDSAARTAWIASNALHRKSLSSLTRTPEIVLASITAPVLHMTLLGPIPNVLSPWAAVPGDIVTILGQGFSTRAKVYVQGIKAQVLYATSHTIRFRVPPQLKKLYRTLNAWVTVESFGRMSGPVPKRLKIYPEGPRWIGTITTSITTPSSAPFARTLRGDRVIKIEASRIREYSSATSPSTNITYTAKRNTEQLTPKDITSIVGLPMFAVTNTNNSITFLDQSTYHEAWTSTVFDPANIMAGAMGTSPSILTVDIDTDNKFTNFDNWKIYGHNSDSEFAVNNSITSPCPTPAGISMIAPIPGMSPSAMAILFEEDNLTTPYSVKLIFARITENIPVTSPRTWTATCNISPLTVPNAIDHTPVKLSDSGHLAVAYGNWPQPGITDNVGIPTLFVFTVDDQVRPVAWIRRNKPILAVDIADDESWISVTDEDGTTIYNVEGPQ